MPTPTPSHGREFYLVQARVRAMVEEQPETALAWFRDRAIDDELSPAERDALDYGIAIALQRKGDFAEARETLNGLLAKHQSLAYEIQIADLDLDSGYIDAAIERLEGMYHNFPGNHAISGFK
jgi:predicted Zn-dependent protease